jgi:hypothetical protein
MLFRDHTIPLLEQRNHVELTIANGFHGQKRSGASGKTDGFNNARRVKLAIRKLI